MDRIKTIDNLIKDYKDSDLSEADTRYKIIDTILQDILAWPKGPTTCEKFINGNYADYVLYKLNGKPALVIEAKKEGKYFNLINNNNSSSKLRMMKVDTLLTDKEIQTATLQVKSYCEDLGCDYGAICNGHQWIIFYFNPINTPWKSLQAIVITSIDYFKESLTDAYNLLGYNSIVNHDSLRSSLGLKSIIHGEIFYPKSNITCYDMPVTNNRYAAAMQIIGRNFFSNIPPQDHEFMQQCYVSHRQYQDSIESGVKQIISDSLTPFFKIQGYKDIWDDKRGGAFGNRVAQIIRDENRQNVIILFGGRGSGKSTFIQRLLYFICPPEIKHFSEIVLINLINCTQNPDQLSNEIWSKICANIDVNGIISGDRNRLLDLFDDRFSIYKKQILIDLEPTSVEYQRLLSEFIINNKNDIKYCCIKLAQEIMSHQKGVIIVFDNMDHLGPELQDLCFLTANEVADKLACTV